MAKFETNHSNESWDRQRLLLWFVGILLALSIAWTLHYTLWVTMPIAVAFFIAVTAWPIVEAVQRNVPRYLGWLGYVAAMASVVAALAAFLAGVWLAALQVTNEWPKYSDRLDEYWDEISIVMTGDPEAGSSESGSSEGDQSSESIVSFVSEYAVTLLTSFGQIVGVLVLIFFLVILMLAEARLWRDKIARAKHEESTGFWLRLFSDDVGARIRWYLLVRTVLGIATAGLYGAWLWAFDIDLIATWMLLAFLLNYIPTLGSLVAGVLPAAFAFLQREPVTATFIGLGVLAIEQVMGNYIDPLIQGRQLSLSPLVVLISLAVWGWIWGIAGAVLAVPMTVVMLLVFARIPATEPIALALSGQTDHEALRNQIDH